MQDKDGLYYPSEILDQNQEDPHALAMTGPKDVIIIIDTSYTMLEDHKIYFAIEAAVKAVNALTYAD